MKGLKKMTTKLFWKIRIWKSLEPLLFSMMIPMLSFNILNLDFGYPTKPIKYVVHFHMCYLAQRIKQPILKLQILNLEIFLTNQIWGFADETKENQETRRLKLVIIGLKIYDNSNS